MSSLFAIDPGATSGVYTGRSDVAFYTTVYNVHVLGTGSVRVD